MLARPHAPPIPGPSPTTVESAPHHRSPIFWPYIPLNESLARDEPVEVYVKRDWFQ